MMQKGTYSAVLENVQKITFREFPIPTIGDDDALLEVEIVGVCGSDVGMYTGKTKRVQPYFPIILGMKFWGISRKRVTLSVCGMK